MSSCILNKRSQVQLRLEELKVGFDGEVVRREDLVGNASCDVARFDRLQHTDQLQSVGREPDVVDSQTPLVARKTRADRLVALETKYL